MLRGVWLLSILWVGGLCVPLSARAADVPLRVMTFNLWQGGEAGGQPLQQSAQVIRRARADVVGIQESHGREVNGVRTDHGPELAKILGWHYQPQAGRTGVLSRFPIIAVTPEHYGVEVEYRPGQVLWFFNVHFAASPYQPYQLLQIPYGEFPFISSAAEAVEWAHRARGEQVTAVLQDLRAVAEQGAAVVLTGDFNEPSFQDWTVRSQQAGVCPLAVAYPAAQRVTAAGLQDTFRVVHPDEVQHPGFTWTPLTRADDASDHHDRIDFVFASRKRLRVLESQVVGESDQAADVVVTPWPSDHRAVVSTVRVLPAGDVPSADDVSTPQPR